MGRGGKEVKLIGLLDPQLLSTRENHLQYPSFGPHQALWEQRQGRLQVHFLSDSIPLLMLIPLPRTSALLYSHSPPSGILSICSSSPAQSFLADQGTEPEHCQTVGNYEAVNKECDQTVLTLKDVKDILLLKKQVACDNMY